MRFIGSGNSICNLCWTTDENNDQSLVNQLCQHKLKAIMFHYQNIISAIKIDIEREREREREREYNYILTLLSINQLPNIYCVHYTYSYYSQAEILTCSEACTSSAINKWTATRYIQCDSATCIYIYAGVIISDICDWFA